MSFGAGKYDEEANAAMLATEAKALVLIVFDGAKGDGISVKLRTNLGAKTMDMRQLAELIREVAKGLDSDRQDQA